MEKLKSSESATEPAEHLDKPCELRPFNVRSGSKEVCDPDARRGYSRELDTQQPGPIEKKLPLQSSSYAKSIPTTII